MHVAFKMSSLRMIFYILLGIIELTEGYDMYCRKNYCPPDRPFCKDFQCFTKCPSSSYTFLHNCISSCPGNYYANGKVCTTKCPISKQYNENGHCTDKCSAGMVSYNDTCVNTCPNGTFLIHDKCEKTCPSSHYMMQGKTEIVRRNNLKSFPIMLCLNECPNYTAKVNHSCHTKCPDKQVLFNYTCVDICPASNQFIMVLQNDMNKIPVCLTKCPSNTFIDGKACVSYCPSDKYVDNDTCVLQCSETLPLLCEYSKCTTEPENRHNYIGGIDKGKGECLSQCPDKHIHFNSECVRFCRQTPLKFLLNGTCIQQCPSNLSYGEDNMCIEDCPKHTFLNGNRCTDHCPSNLIPVDGQCYSSCPKSHPFNYTYKKRVRSSIFYWTTQTISACLKTCPRDTFDYNFQCVKKCPIDLFTFNASCIGNCPTSHSFTYTNKEGHLSCVDKQPERTFRVNESFFDSCPRDKKFVLNGTCLPSCPIDYPFASEAFVFNRVRSVCVETCVNNTLVLNTTCVPRCPKGFHIFNGECLEHCPNPNNITYILSRNYTSHPWELIKHKEDASFCISTCNESIAHATNTHPDCLYKSNNRVHFVTHSCNALYPTSNIEWKVAKCNSKRMFEINNTFYRVCPNEYVHSGSLCAYQCQAEYPFLAPTTRMCLRTCSDQLLKYKNECIEVCPSSTRIINSVCKDVTECPQISQITLKRKEGLYCLKECPPSYFLDEKTCVDKCKGKKVVNKICTVTCPKSHPFEKKGYLLSDIPVCYDICPDNEIGNIKTFQCIYNYECSSFIFEKKCHEKCPEDTFEYIFSTEKGCEYLYKIRIAMAFVILLPCLSTTIFIMFVCIEENKIKEKSTQLIRILFLRNETDVEDIQREQVGIQIEETNTNHTEPSAEENTCFLSADYEMQDLH